MAQRTVRYALVDLTNRTTDLKEVTVDWFGTWGMHLEEMGFWWTVDPSMVALTTGVLTGSGAPGTGAMTWSYMKNGKVQNVTAEGRLGAWLRYAGVDTVVFYGKSEEPLCLTVDDGELTLTEPEADYAAFLAVRKNEDAVIAITKGKALVEDKYFAISDAAVGKRLAEKGVTAIVAEATEALAVADSQRLAGLCVELYQTAIHGGTVETGRKQPARFLSLDHTVSFDAAAAYESPVETAEEEMYAALGMIWSKALAQRDQKADTAALISTCLGVPCTTEELDALEAHLAELKQKKVEGGAV